MLAENPCIIDMIYLDFSKAFDKVDFGILFHKMKDIGITGKLGIWFYHFLVNRTQFVRLPAVLAQIAMLLVVCIKALCLVHCYS